jgi:hypothetical protein
MVSPELRGIKYGVPRIEFELELWCPPNCELRVTEVARRMGVVPSAVSWGLRSLGERMSQDQALRLRVQALTHN